VFIDSVGTISSDDDFDGRDGGVGGGWVDVGRRLKGTCCQETRIRSLLYSGARGQLFVSLVLFLDFVRGSEKLPNEPFGISIFRF
jgi:hypothetical protein